MSRLALYLLVVFVIFVGAFALGTRHGRGSAPAIPPAGTPNAAADRSNAAQGAAITAAAATGAGNAAATGAGNTAELGAANSAAREGVPIGPYGIRMRSVLTMPDQRLAGYLRAAFVAMNVGFAETGQWPTDPAKLPMDRPANTELRIVSTSYNGVRLSAIDNRSKRQCDLFTGDSAKMAFGYAYDPSMPACGKIR